MMRGSILTWASQSVSLGWYRKNACLQDRRARISTPKLVASGQTSSHWLAIGHRKADRRKATYAAAGRRAPTLTSIFPDAASALRL
jgi:hypothetical protein